jgi:hypothetical protein
VIIEREKFRKIFETMEGLYHVMPVTDLKRPNNGKDDDDYDGGDLNDNMPKNASSVNISSSQQLCHGKLLCRKLLPIAPRDSE